MAWTLVMNTRPRLVKNRMLSWVFATTRWRTASSSRVIMASLPLPPRRWERNVRICWRLM